jgi:DNA replication protein DnaC
VVDKYSRCPLLVLDDLGVEKTTDWALQTLYVILNNRYTNYRQTIITSNLTLEEIGNKLGDRIASRIAGMCSIIQMKGKDKRIKQYDNIGRQA